MVVSSLVTPTWLHNRYLICCISCFYIFYQHELVSASNHLKAHDISDISRGKKGFSVFIANCLNEVNAMKQDTIMYASKDVAKRLSVQPVTLRKYAQLLEDKGVSFTKDEKGWRTYSEENIRFLEYLCNMKTMGKSLEEAAAIPLQEEHSFTNFMKAQHEFNQKLVEQLERIEQRQIERDQQLMKAIRETQEAKKQLAATQKKKWWKLF